MAVKHQTAGIIAITVFVAIVFTVSTINSYSTILAGIDTTAENGKSAAYNSAMKQSMMAQLYVKEIPDEWVKQLEHGAENIKEDTDLLFDEEERKNIVDNTVMTRAQLGNHGWSILHMIAATFPDEADDEFVARINLFLNQFGYFYPCKLCGQHWIERTQKRPFDGKTRSDFIQYMCEMHNSVNVDLGKEVFDCETAVHERWGGGCGCGDP